jgi:hypothetical protein
LSEYTRAHGYVYDTGHIVKERVGAAEGGCIRRRVTPLRLWFQTDNARHSLPLTIAQLIPRLQNAVREIVGSVLSAGVILLGGYR